MAESAYVRLARLAGFGAHECGSDDCDTIHGLPTVRELADRCGVGPNCVQRLKGGHDLTGRAVRRIAAALDLTNGEVFEGLWPTQDDDDVTGGDGG